MSTKRAISRMMCITYLIAVLMISAGCNGKLNTDMTDKTEDTAKTSKSQTQNEDTTMTTEDTTSTNKEAGETTQAETETAYGDGMDLKPVFKDEAERLTIEVEYAPETYTPSLEEYTVNVDLSNIENLKQFGEFTKLQTQMLSQNGFVVTPSDEEQLFYIYEKNEYLKLPSFITVDSVLQVYHIFFDYSLRKLESEQLLGSLEQLTKSMLTKSIYLYDKISRPEVKAEALVNTAYFGVAQLVLEKELPKDMPQQARELAQKEFELVMNAAGFTDSFIFPFKLDYSQYKPRGHYTRNEDFERFFRTMMWYGQVPFNVYADNVSNELDVSQVTRALLMTYALFLEGGGSSDLQLWENIYDPTVFYVGKADDLTIYDFKEPLVNVYSSEPDINKFMDEENLAKLKTELEKLPDPEIQTQFVNTPSGKQFRFMGQRYIPDSEILQKLVVWPERPMPKGLDVMGILGSGRSLDLLVNMYKIPEQWAGYTDAFKKMEEKFSGISQDRWRSNMYYGWLWVLKSQLETFDEGYPSFMRNGAWADKSLNTALASWAELRHDTILYGKQSGAECGGGAPPEVIKGYVEPNVELYQKLLWLTRYSKENLTSRGILPDDLKNRMQHFEDMLSFLINCSVKELKNEELTEQEYMNMLTYGATLEYLTSSLADQRLRWFEITSETDKNMAVIADVHTVRETYLEEGVGPAHQIFVVVPIGGKLYLTRGAVFSYYEFESNKRLTDEEWQKMIKDGQTPQRPEWTENFEGDRKDEIPVPAEPYESGC
jgi:hypothetical protein